MPAEPLRVVFITRDDPLYIGEFFSTFLATSVSGCEVVGVAALDLPSSLLTQARRWAAFWGWGSFARLVLRRLRYRLADRLKARGFLKGVPRSPLLAAHYVGAPTRRTSDAEGRAFLAWLEARRPDVIASVAAPKRFGGRLLSIARLAAINLHSGKLPRYRGQMPVFWQLHDGRGAICVTVHVMNEAIDDGAILAQQEIPVDAGASLNAAMVEAKRVGADLVAAVLTELASDAAQPRPNPVDEGHYFPFPTRQDVDAFKRRGYRMV